MIKKETLINIGLTGIIALFAGIIYLDQTKFELKRNTVNFTAGTDIEYLIGESFISNYADIGKRVNITVDASDVNPLLDGDYYLYIINQDTGEKLRVKVVVNDSSDPQVIYTEKIPELHEGETLNVESLIISASDETGIAKKYFEMNNGIRFTTFTAGDPGYYPMTIVVEDLNGRTNRKILK